MYDSNVQEEINVKTSKNNTKNKMFERILSNMLAKKISFDFNIYENSKLKKINSHKNFNFTNKNFLGFNNHDYDINNNNIIEIFSASKVNEYEMLQVAQTSKCKNNFEQKNYNRMLFKTKTNEHNKTNDAKDFCKKTRHSECTSSLNNSGKILNKKFID